MPKVARVVTKMHTNAIPTFLQIKVVIILTERRYQKSSLYWALPEQL